MHMPNKPFDPLDPFNFGSFFLLVVLAAPTFADAPDQLRQELKDAGWIIYAHHADKNWDLHAIRPDGSDDRNLTNSKDTHEFDPQISADGAKLLYRKLPRTEGIDQNNHGRQGQLFLASADAANAQQLGADGEFPWASFSPDGKQIACLTQKGIIIVDLATKKTLSTLPRKNFFQQMTWSPDGLSLVGVSNGLGTAWAIGRMNIKTGEVNAVSKTDCCTPDWSADSKQIVYSHRPTQYKDADGKEWTQLWLANAEGTKKQLLFAKEKQHIYGGCLSPDSKYVLFNGNIHEDGNAGTDGSLLRLIRLADTPMIGGPIEKSPTLAKLYPNAKTGPILELKENAWEPIWTKHDIFKKE
jgi:Tol biopolymer transport system component